VDAGGRIFVSGVTASRDFETLPTAVSSTYRGGRRDAFLRVYGPTGRLLFSSFLGGSDAEGARHVAVDALGNPVIVGSTASVDFPITAGAYRGFKSGDIDAFLTKVNLAGALTEGGK
jgi:hypothetical protein